MSKFDNALADLDGKIKVLDDEPKDEAEIKAVRKLVLAKAMAASKSPQEAPTSPGEEIPDALRPALPSKIQGSKMASDGL